jgi:hypothetical protein
MAIWAWAEPVSVEAAVRPRALPRMRMLTERFMSLLLSGVGPGGRSAWNAVTTTDADTLKLPNKDNSMG